jgi:nickel/cobalt transporter (NicO) family protein
MSTFIRSALILASLALAPGIGNADTVASLLGNFTINQYCGLKVSQDAMDLHFVVVFGQLPALRELHLADADGNGVTSQAERDAYVGTLAPQFAESLKLFVDGRAVPLRAVRWTSSLPVEAGGFSLRVDVDLAASLPTQGATARRIEFTNDNYSGQLGWHEIVVEPAGGLSVFATNAFSNSLTHGLVDALKTLPASGPLDERAVHFKFETANGGVQPLPLRERAASANTRIETASESTWIERRTRQLVDEISSPTVGPRVGFLALLGALILGAVHALSPGHGKTIVGAYLIGSRGTAKHAAFLGLTVTITHTLGVFALGFATLYASRFIAPERLFPILSLVSAILVLGMGVFLLRQRMKATPATFTRIHAAVPAGVMMSVPMMAGMHSHGGGPMHSHLPPGASGEPVTWRNLLALGISGGLVPCPSAMVLLLAAVALNKTAYGMVLVVAFSVGLAITLTVVGLAFLYARNRFARPSADSRWSHLLPVLSAGAITVLGVILCVAALRTFGPIS